MPDIMIDYFFNQSIEKSIVISGKIGSNRHSSLCTYQIMGGGMDTQRKRLWQRNTGITIEKSLQKGLRSLMGQNSRRKKLQSMKHY